MNRGVTDGASLVLRRLIVKIRSSRGAAETGGGVALQAKNIKVTGLNQVRIRRAMRGVAGHTTLGFDGLVLEHEGSLFVDVASEAHGIARGS